MPIRERVIIGLSASVLTMAALFLITSEQEVFRNGERVEIIAAYNATLNWGLAVSDQYELLTVTRAQGDEVNRIFFRGTQYWHFSRLAGFSDRQDRGGVDYPEN